jgi:hypothetical protein
MIVFYESANTEFEPGETEQVVNQEQSPRTGDTLSMGCDRQWIVLDVDTYTNGSNNVYVAHCEPVGVEPLPREKWYWVKSYKEGLLAGEANSLKLFVSDGKLVSDIAPGMPGLGTGPLVPQIRTVLPTFNIGEHTTSLSAWGIVAIDEYSPEEDKQLIFARVYVCTCECIPELAAA